METLHIIGQQRLEGEIDIRGSKQSALSCIAAALLTEDIVVIENMPMSRDVEAMMDIVRELGVKVTRSGEEVTIDASRAYAMPLLNSETRHIRASIYLLGVLAARFEKGALGLPGGYAIGPRPIDLHIKVLEKLGVTIENEAGLYHVTAKQIVGNRVYLDVPSYGATVSAMLTAVLAEGTTTLENAACDPEIVDLATMLTSMGAKVVGAGTDEIRVKGVERLHGCRHTLIPDRMEAGTYLIYGATLGAVTVNNVIPKHLESVVQKLKSYGARVTVGDEWITVEADRFEAMDVRVFHYSGFPSDLQPIMTAALLNVEGTSIVTDKLYPQRFRHVAEMRRMNASMLLEEASVIIRGGENLSTSALECHDPRGGAALVLAAMQVPGESMLIHSEHLEDSYVDFVGNLKKLGAIVWVETRTVNE